MAMPRKTKPPMCNTSSPRTITESAQPGVPRRAFVLGTLVPLLAGCSFGAQNTVDNAANSQGQTPPVPVNGKTSSGSPTASVSANPVPTPYPWDGPQVGLPGDGKYIAWTVDDGKSPEVVRAYADFAAKTGTRLTFFINGSYDSFEQNLDVLAPLVTSGQIQIGNHTWSHAALTDLDDAGIIEELEKNDREIERLFGMSSKPYFRPPYGYYDRRVLDTAARAGFDRPTLWYGSLADSSPITSEEIYKYASTYANPQTILIGHLNYTGVIAVLDKIKALLDERGLVTVTLRDYYGG